MSAASPCERCLSPPEQIAVPDAALPNALPASVAWLRSQDPGELLEMLRTGKAALAAKDMDALKRMEARTGAAAGSDEARVFLSTVVLSLAARGSVTLFAVSHHAGWTSRLLGQSASAAIHIAASKPGRENEGAVEAKLLDAVRRGSGSNTPHGPSIRAAIESMFPSSATNPGFAILVTAKEDAIARGVGRWTSKEEIPPLTDGSGSFLDRALERLGRGLRFYEILPVRKSAVASQFAALEALRRAVAARDAALLSRLEEEIERGLRARTSVDD